MAPEKKQQRKLNNVVDRNIKTLIEARRQADKRRGLQRRLADFVGEFAGSLSFIYVHVFVVTMWLLINTRVVDIVKPWDPYPFVFLATCAALEAIFLSTFVLINQNRSLIISEKRADLDLQISLLTEHELTRLIHMTELVMEKVGATPLNDVEEIKKDVPPELVMERMEKLEMDEPGSQSH